jgi:hypothetical protein
MKDAYGVLRQKEHEQSRLKIEVEALRVVAPLLDDVESENNQPTLRHAVKDTPHTGHNGRADKGMQGWP